jgi:hypothetical protein
VGSKGTHLLHTRDDNQGPLSVAVANGQESANALRPYLGFAGITSYQTTSRSMYHSLQTSLVRRFSAGLLVQAAYTFSKSMDDDVTPLNSYASHDLEWALSSFDRTHMLLLSYVWDLPFASHSSGWGRKLLHGWQISGISSFESGNPMTIGISPDRAGNAASGERPNLLAPVSLPKTIAEWFTTASFGLPALGQFGNAGRSLVRGPGINNWDAAFSRRIDIRENLALQFRGEFFNFFNHTQFSSVGTTLASATFGQVTGARNPRVAQLGLRLIF